MLEDNGKEPRRSLIVVRRYVVLLVPWLEMKEFHVLCQALLVLGATNGDAGSQGPRISFDRLVAGAVHRVGFPLPRHTDSSDVLPVQEAVNKIKNRYIKSTNRWG